MVRVDFRKHEPTVCWAQRLTLNRDPGDKTGGPPRARWPGASVPLRCPSARAPGRCPLHETRWERPPSSTRVYSGLVLLSPKTCDGIHNYGVPNYEPRFFGVFYLLPCWASASLQESGHFAQTAEAPPRSPGTARRGLCRRLAPARCRPSSSSVSFIRATKGLLTFLVC